MPMRWEQLERWSSANLNFYRVHVLFFVFVPLIFSGIFYASNGETQISYVDSLFSECSFSSPLFFRTVHTIIGAVDTTSLFHA